VTELLQAKLSFGMLDADIPMDPTAVRYQGMTLGWIPKVVPVFNADLDGEAQITLSPFSGNLLIAGGNYRWAFATGKYMDPEDIHQHRVGVFVHDEQRLWERLTLVGSVRFDYNSLTPYTISPRVACIWQFAGDQFARLAFGRAFRKPSFFNSSIHLKGVEPAPAFPEIEDLFKNGIGNEDVNNESITSIEAGYHGRFFGNRLVLEADVFYNLYRDTINFHLEFPLNEFGLPDLSRSVAEYRNAGREVDSVGGSASVTFRMRGGWRFNANYTFRHSFYVSDPKGVGATGAGKQGDRVAWEPAHLLNLACHWAPELGPRLGITVHAASSYQGYVSSGGAFDARVPVPQDATISLNGFCAWRFGFGSRWLEAGLRLFNLLNSPYYDYPGTINPEGIEVGGELLVRRITLYVRGVL
jgi:outer membrane receptor for ferrienterochelin and colicin